MKYCVCMYVVCYSINIMYVQYHVKNIIKILRLFRLFCTIYSRRIFVYYIPYNGLCCGGVLCVCGNIWMPRAGCLRFGLPILPLNAVGTVCCYIDDILHIICWVLLGLCDPVQFPTCIAPSFGVDCFTPTAGLRSGQQTHERLLDCHHRSPRWIKFHPHCQSPDPIVGQFKRGVQGFVGFALVYIARRSVRFRFV